MDKRKMFIEVTKAEADLINEGALSKAAETKWGKIGNISTSDLVTELLKRRCFALFMLNHLAKTDEDFKKESEKKLDEGRLRHGLEVLKGAILPEGF